MNKIAGKFPEPATEYFYIKWSQEMFGVNSLLTGKKKKKILMSFCKQFSLLINSVASLEFFFPFNNKLCYKTSSFCFMVLLVTGLCSSQVQDDEENDYF